MPPASTRQDIFWTLSNRRTSQGGWPLQIKHGGVVNPGYAVALRVAKGARLRVVDLEGGQPGHLVAFLHGDREEWFSPARTRAELQRVRLQLGDALWSNLGRPLLRLQQDDCSAHDLLLPACDHAFSEDAPASCRVALFDALGSVPFERVPDALGLFYRTDVRGDGIVRLPAASKPGDATEWEALHDLVVAVVACGEGPLGDGKLLATALFVEVLCDP